MSEKTYVSEHNYYPGTTQISAGCVFTEEQWCDCGGKAESLKEHIKKGYITENVQYVPEKAVVQEAEVEILETVKIETVPIVQNEEAPKAKAQGIWNYTKGELEMYDIATLNTIYKDRAAEFGIQVKRPFTNKENLITKMTSENNED